MTLLEVIVAMTLLSIGIVSVLSAMSSCLRSSDAAGGYSRGALLAQQVAAELERNEELEPGDLNGTFDDVSDEYAWAAEVGTVDEQGCYPVRILVSWQNGARHFELQTRLKPRALPVGPPTMPQDDASTPGGGNGTGNDETPGDDDDDTPGTGSGSGSDAGTGAGSGSGNGAGAGAGRAAGGGA